MGIQPFLSWLYGFYPGLQSGQPRSGSAPTFEAARTEFEAAWSKVLPIVPDGAFDEWRYDGDRRAEMKAKCTRGEKLDSKIPSSLRLRHDVRQLEAG